MRHTTRGGDMAFSCSTLCLGMIAGGLWGGLLVHLWWQHSSRRIVRRLYTTPNGDGK